MAKEQLTQWLDLAVKGERLIIQRNRKPVAAIIGLHDLQQLEALDRNNRKARRRLTRREQDRLINELARKLGDLYVLSPAQSRRLTQLIEKQDQDESLTPVEKKELQQLLKAHESLMVKRAQALDRIT